MDDFFLAAREATLAALTRLAESERRIRALWLQGSLAAGGEDAFSDIDAYVAADEADFDSLWAARESLLGALGGALAWSDATVPGLKAVHALMANGARLDLFFERAEAVGEAKRPAVKVLLDKVGMTARLQTGWEAPTAQIARTIVTIIRMTRQGAVWPLRVLGRGQWSTLAKMELWLINEQLVQLMAVAQDPGNFYKNPNSQPLLISAADRALVDDLTAAALPVLAARDAAALKPTHLRLTDALVVAGRAACATLGADYPLSEASERAVRDLIDRAWPGQ
jgi:predicted nucleotidyltransferase